MGDTWQLAPAVILRPESFGGMVFQREIGLTLELDHEAYQFLCSFVDPRPLPPPEHPAAYLAPQLIRWQVLSPAKADAEQRQRTSAFSWTGSGLTLSVPETVHLALTGRCNLFCPGCYALPVGSEPELTEAELRSLIDQWAQMRVFQLAIGGGEPLLRRDTLLAVVTYAHQRGIVPNLTTNGLLLTEETVLLLAESGLRRINLSWNGPDDPSRDRSGLLSRVLPWVLNSSLQVGVNLLVTPPLLSRLTEILAWLEQAGIGQVTLLRPKPPAVSSSGSLAWHETYRLQQSHLPQLAFLLKSQRHKIRLEVDCALVCLMDDLPLALLRQRAIYGCTAGRRICTVWPDGRVTPCSFLAHLSAGNVRRTPFADLWRRGENWASLRHPSVHGWAGCAIAPHCGGACCLA